jgi:hypothetical protein
MVPFDVEAVVLCDDIRQEANGKYLLIGVYGSNIVVRGFPTDLRLAIWILAHPKALGRVRARIRVRGPQGSTLVEGGMEIDVRDKETAAIMAIPGLPLQIQGAGRMRLEWAANDDDDWTEIKSISVMQDPRLAPGNEASEGC